MNLYTAHQIRVHLQYLGHPVANDPIYTGKIVWVRHVVYTLSPPPFLVYVGNHHVSEFIQGEKIGRGGLDVTPSDERAPPVFPAALRERSRIEIPLESSQTAELVLTKKSNSASNPDVDHGNRVTVESSSRSVSPPKLLPRESGLDVGMGSPVPLSAEAVNVITRLRNMKDKDEDWSRWRDVVFRAKGAKLNLGIIQSEGNEHGTAEGDTREGQFKGADSNENDSTARMAELIATGLLPSPSYQEPNPDPSTWTAKTESGTLYCTECYLPLHPDPEPERLYIFLHALRYTTSLGSFETEMPMWAEEGWKWQGK